MQGTPSSIAAEASGTWVEPPVGIVHEAKRSAAVGDHQRQIDNHQVVGLRPEGGGPCVALRAMQGTPSSIAAEASGTWVEPPVGIEPTT